MGIVCTSLVGYALGFDFPWGSAQYPYLAEKGFFETVKGNNVQSLKLMDILHEDGHASLITDIWRNKKGFRFKRTEGLFVYRESRLFDKFIE